MFGLSRRQPEASTAIASSSSPQPPPREVEYTRDGPPVAFVLIFVTKASEEPAREVSPPVTGKPLAEEVVPVT
jgi:hypothetical protein